MEKIWLKSYQDGVQTEIDEGQYHSLNTIFEKSCKKYAKNTAYLNFGTKITYKCLEEKALKIAKALQSYGLIPGQRVAIMLPNIIQYPMILFGTLLAGGVVVNTNPLFTAEEIIYQLNDAGAKFLFVLSNFAHTIEKALPNLKNIPKIITTELGDAHSFLKGKVINFIVKYIKKSKPKYNLPKSISLQNFLKIPSKTRMLPQVSGSDIAFLQYTGGTTGVTKAAMLTHHNMIANLLQATAWMSPVAINEKDIVVTALPLYHIFSLTANCLTFMYIGATNLLITNPRDTTQLIREIRKVKFTIITGVNTLFNTLLNHKLFNTINFSQTKLALSGGMTLQKNVAARWHEITKTKVLEAYGLTEASPAVTISPLNLKSYNGSIGLPIPSTNISIRNENNEEVDINTPGELCVKGPQVMSGYWRQPLETSLVFTQDGFLKTGDIVKIDHAGFLYLVDRKKDLIVVSGFNVYPNELEQVLSLHQGIQEAGVVGILDHEGNERVKACIVKKDQSLTSRDIITYCRAHLAAYKVPKIIEFYDSLPKSNIGKVLRRELKNLTKE